MAENIGSSLAKYVHEIFDLNRDGKVTVKEFFSVLIPNYAVGIALIVVDLLAVVAEYRVWDVGMTITGGDFFKAIGFVLVSLLPFYLGQVLWLYPRATFGQQAISVGMVFVSLLTSAQFGLADLSQKYDVTKIVNMVIWLTFSYIVALLVYVLIDKNIRLYRAKVQAQATAAYQKDVNAVGRSVLSDLRLSLEDERALRDEFGDEAVEAHLSVLRGKNKKQEPVARGSGGGGGDKHTKTYPHWELEALLKQLDLSHSSAVTIANTCENADAFYQAMKPYGIEAVEISRQNFGNLYGQLRYGQANPTKPPRPNQ